MYPHDHDLTVHASCACFDVVSETNAKRNDTICLVYRYTVYTYRRTQIYFFSRWDRDTCVMIFLAVSGTNAKRNDSILYRLPMRYTRIAYRKNINLLIIQWTVCNDVSGTNAKRRETILFCLVYILSSSQDMNLLLGHFWSLHHVHCS